MGRAALQRRLQKAEDLMQRVEENIVFQREMIATLERGGHDAKAATIASSTRSHPRPSAARTSPVKHEGT